MFGTLTLWLLVETLKTLLDRERPFLTLASTCVIGWREKGESFPSGHTSQMLFLTTLFFHDFQLGVVAAAALFAVATLVGITRIYPSVHYPRDVLAGVVLGSVLEILATLADPYWHLLRF